MRNDQQLKSDVEWELKWDPSLKAEQIGVSAKDGVIELDGHVDSYFEKWSAERAALKVTDVKAVASEIKVELPTSSIRTDEDIARTASEQLEWNLSVPDTVKVQVTDGRVSLVGTTDWQYQKVAAEKSVRSLQGVTWLFNQIKVTPRANAGVIKVDIENALKRHAETDAKNIMVETAGGMVTLTGKVSSWGEREDAQRAAWAAPGVTMVKDMITIH
jgi:osmotically-inducible protein OsmY